MITWFQQVKAEDSQRKQANCSKKHSKTPRASIASNSENFIVSEVVDKPFSESVNGHSST
jgi:hypothetical protein